MNFRIGGRKGKFSFTRDYGARPCFKCLLEKKQRQHPQLNKTEDDVKDESFNEHQLSIETLESPKTKNVESIKKPKPEQPDYQVCITCCGS